MNTERRNGIALSETDNQLVNRRSYPTLAKPFEISKRQVFEAYKEVRANKGGAVIDGQTLTEFDHDLGNNLYQLWTRLASGSYFPSAFKRVNIPKGIMHKKVRGWINYFGHFETKKLKDVLFHLDRRVVQWIRKKYKRLRFVSRAFDWLRRLRERSPNLFTHWQFIYQKVGQ